MQNDFYEAVYIAASGLSGRPIRRSARLNGAFEQRSSEARRRVGPAVGDQWRMGYEPSGGRNLIFRKNIFLENFVFIGVLFEDSGLEIRDPRRSSPCCEQGRRGPPAVATANYAAPHLRGTQHELISPFTICLSGASTVDRTKQAE